MSKVLELREERAKVWEEAKRFLTEKSKDGEFMRGEDAEAYDRMEKRVMDLGKQIDILERQADIDAEMARPTSKPLTTDSIGGAVNLDVKRGRASDAYKNAFWDAMRNNMTYEIRDALTVGTDSEGGYLVPDEYEKTLVSALNDEVFFRNVAHVITTGSGDRAIPVVASRGEAAWIDEGGAFPESQDSFGQITIGANKLATIIKVSDELLNDSVFDIEDYIAKEFARRIGAKEEEAFLVGDGSKKPLGVFKSAEKGVEIASTSISFDDIMDLYHSLRAPYRAKASFILNDSTIKAIRKIKDSNGNYIWQPSVREGEPDRILNRPYRTSEYAPELAAGSTPIAFGDFSYYWIGDRQGRNFKRLNELYAATGHVGFLASERVDGKLILPEAVKTLSVKTKATA